MEQAVESTLVMINLFGAVALLLFGLSQVKDGATRAFGSRLRTGLSTGTRTPIRSFVAGFIATVALQSSTATALMTASFVERALIQPRMAQILLLGANLGTAVTAWLVAIGMDWLAPLAILIGVVLYRGAKSSAYQGLGTALVGIGLMLLSLRLLGSATEPMRESPALAAFLRLLDGAWPVALVFAAILAFISSSSLAVVMLVLSLSSAGILTGGLTVVLVLGANLGGAITPVVATLKSPPAARRVTIGNLAARALGCIIVLPLAGVVAEQLATLPIPAEKLPVDIHLLFNLALAIVIWPLSGLLSKLTLALVKDDEQPDFGPLYLDESQIATPVVALSGATREVLRVGDIIEAMLMKTMHAFETNDSNELKGVSDLEKRVDLLQQEVKIYLSKLGRAGLSEADSHRSINIIDYAINLEHVGDIIEKGLSEQVAKKIRNGLKFSEDGYGELKALFALTLDNLRLAQTILVTGDTRLALQLMEVKVEVRRLEKQSAEKHLERLRDGRLDSLHTSSLHLDILRDLKRINAHLVSVTHPILDQNGLLGESRLHASSES